MEAATATRRPFTFRLPQGPKLQLLNLTTFFIVVNLTLDYPNALWHVLLTLGLTGVLDAVASRHRFGGWRIPWPSLVGALGATLVIQGYTVWTYVLLAVIMVGSKHLIRWRGRHLFNPNNLAMAVLLLLGSGSLFSAAGARIGVTDWGGALQAFLLMFFFGTVATTRVRRFDLAMFYFALLWTAYGAIALYQNLVHDAAWGIATVFHYAFNPLQVMIGLFAITDPATSPHGRLEKLLWAFLLVLIGIPATLSGRIEAPVFALLIAAPQRHVISWLVNGRVTTLGPPVPVPRPSPVAGGTTALAATSVEKEAR